MEYNIIAAARFDKLNDAKQLPLCINIYKGSKLVKRVSLGQKVHIDFWDKESRTVSKKCPLATLLNSTIEKKIFELKTSVLSEQILTGKADIKEIIVKEKIKDLCFYSFAGKQIVQKKYADETRRAYGIVLDKLRNFKQHLKLTEINYELLQGFEAHLRNDLKNNQNTIWGNFKVINTFISDAVKLGYIKAADNPFNVFKRPKYSQGQKDFLNDLEILALENFTATAADDIYLKVAKYYLFMCRTGLRFSDARRFNAAEHIKDGNRIVIETQKTKQTANLFINHKIAPLIEYIKDNKLIASQQYFNRCLKQIAAGLGIDKKITSHTGRHTFGASLVSLGVPEKVAQGLLAHGSAASTKIYYHLDAPALDAAMLKFNK